MTANLQNIVLLYGAAVSLWGAGAAVWDKLAAIRHARRIPERTLLLIGALGGAAAMLPTMLLIRHKTRHPRFMVGLPLMLLVQAGLVWLAAEGPDAVISWIRRLTW